MKQSPDLISGTSIPKTITTDNTEEFNAVLARATAGEFHLLNLKQGETNSQWVWYLGRPFVVQEKLKI